MKAGAALAADPESYVALFDFWRGKRLRAIEPLFKVGGDRHPAAG